MKTRHNVELKIFFNSCWKIEILDFHEKNKEISVRNLSAIFSHKYEKIVQKFLERIIFYSKKKILFKTAERNFLKWELKLRSVSHSFRFFIHFLLSIFKTNFIFRKKYSSSSQSRTVRWKGAITCWKRAITSDKIRIEKYTLYFWKAEKNLHRMRFKKTAFEVLKK